MRSPTVDVLSTIVAVIVMLATACSASTTVDADASGSQNVSPQPAATAIVVPVPEDSEPGAAVDPLPTAAPTVGLVTGEASTVTLADLAVPSIQDREVPITGGSPAVLAQAQITSIDIRIPPRPSAIDLDWLPTNGSNMPAAGFTPDDLHIWVPLHDPNAAVTCPDSGVDALLGIAAVDNSMSPRPAEPVGELPPNVTEIHRGPSDRVVLYTTCGSSTHAAAVARVTPQGDFLEVRRLHPVLEASERTYPPRWVWASDGSYEDPGRLTLIIPQVGLAARGGEAAGPADVYVDVTSGDIVDVWPNQELMSVSTINGRIFSDGETLDALGEADAWTGAVTALKENRGWHPGYGHQIVATGLTGASLIELAPSAGNYGPQAPAVPTITPLTDQLTLDVAWGRTQSLFALTGPSGTTLFQHAVPLGELQPNPGDSVAFSLDGSRLLVAGPTGYQVYEFGPAEAPDDSRTVTAFSELDSGGLGPIRIGMTVAELRAQLGTEVTMDGIGGVEVGYCVWIDAPDLPGISMLGEATSSNDAIITSLTVWEGPWSTPSGIRLGTSHDAVLSTFGDQIDVLPHKYTNGKYLDFKPADAADPHGVRFTSNNHEVSLIAVGRHEWIQLVEGCA